MTFLFIGGSIDGQTRNLTELLPHFKVNAGRNGNDTYAIEQYTCHAIYLARDKIKYVYGLSTLTVEQVFDMLLEGYAAKPLENYDPH